MDTKMVPLSQQKEVQKLVLERAIPEFSGRSLSAADIIGQKSAAWSKGFTQASKAGQSAKATFERLVGGVLKEELAKVSPASSAIDKVLSAGHKAGKATKFITKAIPTALLGWLGIKNIGR
jgi:hypothetical protein